MPAGTIALSNNSTTVTGTGTAFTAELKANDFIVSTVGGVTYTLGIDSVDSATVLTLIKAYDGPTVSGAAWNALPAAAMSLISAQTAADVARALRAANFDKVNWQQVFSELGDITVTLSDGSQFSGPSWRKISELLATLDVGSITEIAAQIHADADQVATDKPIIEQAKNDAMAANAAAQQAEEGAQAADESAQQSKADATTQAGIAKAEADRAKAEADRAAASNPDNSLLKSQNLNDLPDKSESRKNLNVYSKEEVDGKGGGYVGRAFWHPLRTSVPGGNSPADGQVVNRTGTYASLWAECAAGRLPVVTDAVWLADPTKRGCYSSGDGSTTFRFPDYNGVQPGSIPAPVMRGDGGLTDGTIQQNAAPNIAGSYRSYNAIAATTEENANPSILGAMTLARGASALPSPGYAYAPLTTTNSNSQYAHQFGIDASKSSAVYGRDSTTEIRSNSLVGCWVVQFAGAANNAGSIDALALATRIEQVAQSVAAVAARIDTAIVTSSGTVALNSRTVLPNPFGINTPVIVQAEFYSYTLSAWVAITWIRNNTLSYGTQGFYVEGEGIVIKVGNDGFGAGGAIAAASKEFAADYKTPSPVRARIWKVQS